MSEVKVTTLANGLRVAVDEMPEVESASLGIWVACGTRHESAELNGMAHMLEHMAFKGTKTRSARVIAEEIENVGGSLNAYTGREITAYHASVLKEDVALGVEMVADILRNSVFDPDELQRERGVILQEIGQALDTPDDLIFDQFQETALPEQPLGRPVLGTADSVETIGREDLFAFLARHYTAGNMVLSAAGRVDHAEIVDLAEKYFGSVPRTAANADQPVPLAYVGGDGREARTTLEQVHIVLGGQGIGYRDPDYYATAVYSTLFGGGMSSRLFQRIREERGLVYGINCFNAAYADGGLFGIYAGTGEDDLAELVPAVCEEFAGVADSLTEQELIRARAQIKAGTLMALESSGSRCEQAARHLLIHNRTIPYAEIVARIEAIDQAAVRRVARRLLQGKLTLAALGPIEDLESLDKIAARLAA
jgi:predicted Zn-dependent peptidase